MVVISVWTRKGGTGKTSVTFHLAGCLSQFLNKKVLVIDCDAQCNLTSLFTQAIQKPDLKRTLKDYIDGTESVGSVLRKFSFYRIPGRRYCAEMRGAVQKEDVVLEEEPRSLWKCNISLIPGDKDLDSVKFNDMNILRDMVDELNYDYVLLDCPPAVSSATIAALAASDYVLAPLEPSTYSLDGYSTLIDNITEMQINGYPVRLLGVVFNKVPANETVPAEIIAQMREITKSDNVIFDQEISRTSVQEKTVAYGMPVGVFDALSKYGTQFVGLANELDKKVTRR